MDFPTSGDLAAFRWFLRLRSIHELIARRRPDLVGGISSDDGRLLTVDLPPLGADPRPRVGLAKFSSGTTQHWLISASTGHDIVTSAWGLETPDEVMAEAVAAMWDRCVTGTDASPWRFGQSERSPIVQLAENLSDGGLDVDAVVSTNRFVRRGHGFGDSQEVPASFGEALRLELDRGTVVVSHRPTLGWVMDVDNGSSTRRTDLGRLLTGQSSTTPGLATDQIEAVATGVRRAVGSEAWEWTDRRPLIDILPSRAPELHAAAWWMRELGYAHTEARWDIIESTAHVALWSRQTPIALGDVQRAFAQGTVEGKKPLLITTSHFSRSARRWADDAHIALFTLWGEDFTLYPASNHADEHIPRVF